MSTGSMAPAFDLVLFGFRNDLARARTLAFLQRLPPGSSPPVLLDHNTAMPRRLFAALDLSRAQVLLAQLERLGAQVALLPVELERVPASGSEPSPPERAAPRARPLGVGALPWLLVVALVAAIYIAPPPERWHHVVRRARLPAAEEMEPQPSDEPVNQPAAARLNNDAVQLGAARQFREAVERLEAALRLAPGDPTLMQNLQATLFNWAAADLNAGQLEDAGDRLRRALQLGDRLEVWRALGMTYLRQARYDAAADALERALHLASRDRDTLLALADVYVQEDRRAEAVDLLQRAKEAGAGGPQLDARIAQLSREVDAEWDFVQLQSAHFRVSFADDQDTRAVQIVLDALEDAYDAVGARFDTHPDGRMPVVLYTQQDFHVVTQTPDWAGAAFDGRIKIPVRGLSADDPNLPHIIRHEYAHSVIAQLTGGRCPVWLNEGLAVWAEETVDGERRAWAEERIADQELFTFDQLNGSFVRLPAERVEVAYAQSYLAVRSLVDRYGVRRIPSLLGALKRSHNLNDAFDATYPGTFAGFEQDLLRQLTG